MSELNAFLRNAFLGVFGDGGAHASGEAQDSGGSWFDSMLPGVYGIYQVSAMTLLDPAAQSGGTLDIDGYRPLVDGARTNILRDYMTPEFGREADAADRHLHGAVPHVMDAACGSREDAAVGTRTWPEDWDARRAGAGCPTCAQGRTDETRGGLRFLAGEVADVYLRKTGPLPGYSMAVWRGDHAADFVDLTDEQLSAYWRDVTTATRALYAVFRPAQINYLTYGNNVPHVHTYLLPRYVDDTSPGLPLQPWAEEPVPDALLRQHLAKLRAVIDA